MVGVGARTAVQRGKVSAPALRLWRWCNGRPVHALNRYAAVGHENATASSGTNDCQQLLLRAVAVPRTVQASFRYGSFDVGYEGTMVSSINDGGLKFRGTEEIIKLTRAGFELYLVKACPRATRS